PVREAARAELRRGPADGGGRRALGPPDLGQLPLSLGAERALCERARRVRRGRRGPPAVHELLQRQRAGPRPSDPLAADPPPAARPPTVRSAGGRPAPRAAGSLPTSART